MPSCGLFKKIAFFIFIISSAAHCLWAVESASDNATIPKTIDELKTAIDSLLILHRIPGAGIAIVSEDSIIYMGGLGYANMKEKIPVNEETHFCMGSITKNFVAMGFIKLVDEGRIDLNTQVSEIVPEIEIINPWQKTDPIRIVHLLEHTSGLGNSFKEFNLDDNPEIPLRQSLEVVSGAFKARFRPGTCYSYSNSGYGLAGYILEKITGMRFEDYLKDGILEPIGMTTSTFKITDEYSQKSLAQGYQNNYEESPYAIYYSRPAGNMHSSSRELANYLQFMLNEGKVGGMEIINAELIRRMEIPTTSLASRMGLIYGYGLGIECRYRRGYKWLGHNGATPGFYSDFWYNRDLNVGFVILNNRFDFSGRRGLREIRNLIYAFLVPDSPAITAPTVTLSASQFDRYSGCYAPLDAVGELVGWIDVILGDIKISVVNDTLYYREFLGDRKPLIPMTTRLFRDPMQPDASAIFFTTPEGKEAFVRSGRYFEKIESWKPWITRLVFFGSFIAMLSTIPYAIVWIPVHLFKKIRGNKNRSMYLRMRIIPLVAIVSLLYGSVMLANQNIIYIAQKNFINIQFTIATWLFAGLSFLSLFYAIYSFKKPVKNIARIYALVVSLSSVGVTLFFIYYGMIGLMLWA